MTQSIILAFEKYSPDESSFGTSGLTVADGVAWHSGMYQAISKSSQINADAAGIVGVPGVKGFRSMGAFNPLLFGTATTLYYFNAAAAPVSLGGVLAAGATHWSWTRFGDSIIAADSANPVKVTTNLGATANLITSVAVPRGKYVATIKTHVLLGYSDDGAGGALNGSRFWWCARNLASDWQPGSNRAGFAELRKDVGVITGIVGFEDFGLIFCELGVYRLDYVGGDNVWSPRQIAFGAFGLPAIHRDSIAVIGTDVYYWSRGGPATISAGEQAVPLGSGVVRRQLTEVIAALPGGPVYGASESSRGIVAWGWENIFSAPKGATYNVDDDVWGRFVPPLGGASGTVLGFSQSPDATEIYTMDSIDFVGIQAGTTRRFRFTSQGGQQAIGLRTRRWSPAAGKRSMVHAVRPIVTAFGSQGDPANIGFATVTVEGTNDPHFLSWQVVTTTVDVKIPGSPAEADVRDANGYSVIPMPQEFGFYRMTLNLPATSYLRIGNCIGLEVLFEPGSSIF